MALVIRTLLSKFPGFHTCWWHYAMSLHNDIACFSNLLEKQTMALSASTIRTMLGLTLTPAPNPNISVVITSQVKTHTFSIFVSQVKSEQGSLVLHRHQACISILVLWRVLVFHPVLTPNLKTDFEITHCINGARTRDLRQHRLALNTNVLALWARVAILKKEWFSGQWHNSIRGWRWTGNLKLHF
jgi:hypothetical protein